MLGNRMKQLRKSLPNKMSQSDFGETLGLTRDAVSSYEQGRVIPSEAVIKLICATYNVSALWLKDGIGEMFFPPDTEEEMVDRVMAGENEFAKSIMKAFAKLDDKEWEALKVVVDALKKTGL